jgi:hypothetical protein
MAMAACGADGIWGQCVCAPPAGTIGTTNNAAQMTPHCGNGIVETNLGEQCEQGMTNGATCATLVAAGSQGLLNCTACLYDTSGCMTTAAVPTGGTGARMPQGGAGH